MPASNPLDVFEYLVADNKWSLRLMRTPGLEQCPCKRTGPPGYKKPLVSLVFMIELSVVISIANRGRLLLEA